MVAQISSLTITIVALFAKHVAGQNTIRWGICDSAVVNDTSLSCATLDIPLDYHDASAGKGRLAIIKANAKGERQGTVFYNPGGPGASGLEVVDQYQDILYAVTGGVYDIVSWDPRGVGLSIPGYIECFDNVFDYNALFNGTIEFTGIEETGNFTDPADVEALFSQAHSMQQRYEQVGQDCLRRNEQYLKYLGTAAAVRDMLSIADVIEGPNSTINYIGTSYGTLIGSWFVNMFPERVGRVILDGVADPVNFATLDPSTDNALLLVSADTIYKGLITGCALAGPAGCAAASEGDGPLDIDAKFQALIKAAHDATRQNNGSVPLTSGQIRSALGSELYDSTDWSNFVNNVYPQTVQIVEGESGQNVSVNKRLESRSPEFTRPRNLLKRQADSAPSYTQQAIFCGDAIDIPHGTTMADVFESIMAQTRHVSHIIGSVWPVTFYQCAFWPIRSVERYQGPFNKKLANKILIASNKYDPVTPLDGAQRVAKLLGDSAALVIQNGFGHTTFSAPSKCTMGILAAYMANGTIPENNAVCAVDADFEIFSGVNTADILAHLAKEDV